MFFKCRFLSILQINICLWMCVCEHLKALLVNAVLQMLTFPISCATESFMIKDLSATVFGILYLNPALLQWNNQLFVLFCVSCIVSLRVKISSNKNDI